MSKSTHPYNTPFNVSLIYWTDAYVTTDDNPALEHTDSLTVSIGVIIKEDDKEITISSFYDGISQEFASPYQVIPKGVIKNIRVLKCRKMAKG